MTSRFLYGDQRVIAWAEQKLGLRFRPDARAIGHERQGRIVGAFVFDTFGGGSCQVHVVSDGSWRWLPREFAVVAMAFPFIQCGFRRITGFIAASNARSLHLARRFGMVEEGRLRQAAPDGGDYVVMGMLREECRFLPPAGESLRPGV